MKENIEFDEMHAMVLKIIDLRKKLIKKFNNNPIHGIGDLIYNNSLLSKKILTEEFNANKDLFSDSKFNYAEMLFCLDEDKSNLDLRNYYLNLAKSDNFKKAYFTISRLKNYSVEGLHRIVLDKLNNIDLSEENIEFLEDYLNYIVENELSIESEFIIKMKNYKNPKTLPWIVKHILNTNFGFNI